MSLRKDDTLKNGQYVIADNKVRDGAYGIIYKARDEYSKNFVAIKTPKKPEDRDNLDRFIKEIKALKELSNHRKRHPYIVKYHDDFQEGQKRYLVMDYLERGTLWDLVEKQKLKYRDAFRYIYQIGLALKAAHEKDWIHRDVHPSNIMIVKKSKAVLIDFGIVKSRQIQTEGHPPGNYHFAPYEQKLGKYNQQLDVYALAACLYYALTGERPTPSIERKEDETSFKLPREHDSSISQEIEDAILKGMKLEPKDRPASIEKWLKLLPKTRYWYWQQLINWVRNFFQ